MKAIVIHSIVIRLAVISSDSVVYGHLSSIVQHLWYTIDRALQDMKESTVKNPVNLDLSNNFSHAFLPGSQPHLQLAIVGHSLVLRKRPLNIQWIEGQLMHPVLIYLRYLRLNVLELFR